MRPSARELDRFRGREVKTHGRRLPGHLRRAGAGDPLRAGDPDGVRGARVAIRAGLHTGEIELVGDDVVGIAVHIGARVAAKAQSGEVLVSSTVKDLVVGSGIEFEDRGIHRLKGVPGEWRLHAVQRAF